MSDQNMTCLNDWAASTENRRSGHKRTAKAQNMRKLIGAFVVRFQDQ